MPTISIDTISAFDAVLEHKIAFSYSGNQCIANRITIYNSATNGVVFNQRTESFALSHTIPAGTLTNGSSYYAKITAYYMSGNAEQSIESSVSNVFCCLSTPLFHINDIVSGSIIGNSSLTLSVSYSQEQNDDIDEFYIAVYTSAHTVFRQSPSLYDVESTFTVTGLQDNASYFLRAWGKTVNGLLFDTRNEYPDDILINVDYVSPDVYSLVYLENIADKGYVRVSTNVASIEGSTKSGNDAVYIDNTAIDLRSDRVSFVENILGQGDFTIIITGRQFVDNACILELSGGKYDMFVYWRYNANNKCFAELRVGRYVYYSSYFDRPSNDTVVKIKVSYHTGFKIEVSLL